MTNDRVIHIRDAVASDATRLTEIAHDSKRHWGYDETDIHLWSPQLTISTDFIDRHIVRVAVSVDTLVAFYALQITGAIADIEHFWVERAAIGYRAGSQLFTDAVEQARGAAATELRIVSDPNALGFYEKMGAVVVGKEPSTPEGRFLPVLTLDLEQS